MSTKRETGEGAGQPLRLSKARLDELVEEALVDAYGESKQVTGFYTMMENDLRLPFETDILGITVLVGGIDITGRSRRDFPGGSRRSGVQDPHELARQDRRDL